MTKSVRQHILLLEDDPNLGLVVQDHLVANGFDVTLNVNGEEGLTEAKRKRFDLCLVDVMMPKKDGFTFARQFRAFDTNTPVIFLTAKSLKEDRIEGLTIGADDYITKPFSVEELLLRIRAVLKRSASPAPSNSLPSVVKLGKLKFDRDRQLLHSRAGDQKLTSKESELLELFCAHRNEIVARNDILKSVWGDDSYFNGRSLDVFISRIRKYLSADPSVEIKNAHGKGYKLAVEE
ncbi:MAG TPA: response regulator transcription factor [Bacteroidota bacterium]|nr:response regulator transcription factor [Bacteroidota bacterium]